MASTLGAVVYPDRGHAQRFRRPQVLRHVLDHRRRVRVDPEPFAEQSIAVRVGLGPKLA
jgi:hypothetical protein